jgi:hypothetical protein
MVIIGVFIVNTRYTKLNDEVDGINIISTFISSDKDKLNKNAFLSRIKINKDKDIAIYFNPHPFDFRVSFGKSIFYINRQALEDIKKEVLLR